MNGTYKEISNLVGLSMEQFDYFRSTNQIELQPARLIPQRTAKGDERALTSIFLSTIRLVKEYRNSLFKEFSIKKSGKIYYFTEAKFKDIDESRIDGLIIVVVKNKIIDAAFFEMKSKNEPLKIDQIEKYQKIAEKLNIPKLITISNDFVSDPKYSPIKIKANKKVELLHFSWTYLMTVAKLLLFDNDENIEDEDQVEIMREVLHYLEHKDSGTTGYTKMQDGWKDVVDKISNLIPLKRDDENVQQAVLSWYEEEKDMALLLSRKLGVLVKSPSRQDSAIKDGEHLIKHNNVTSVLSVKNAVSKIKITAEFERKSVIMGITITPPQDKGSKARITWLTKQLENCSKKENAIFESIQKDICIDMDIKNARSDVRVGLKDLHTLFDESAGREIQGFNIVLIKNLKKNFGSSSGFISAIENMILEYYQGIVQHVSTWSKPTPKIIEGE